MSHERFESLRETGWRRPLTGAERDELASLLAAHPDLRGDWETEASLTEALQRLSDAPVHSNFTARVLREIEREDAVAARSRGLAGRGFDLRRWLPRFAVGLAAAGAVLVTGQLYVASNRAKLGESMVMLVEATPAPASDLLTDFDPIRRLNPELGADTELLGLLQ